MLNFQSLFLCIVISVGIGFVLRQRRFGEQAERVARDFCKRNDVIFLDDTVQCYKMRWRKNERGKWRFYRLYIFEYSSEEVERGSGAMAFEGDYMQQIQFVESSQLN